MITSRMQFPEKFILFCHFTASLRTVLQEDLFLCFLCSHSDFESTLCLVCKTPSSDDLQDEASRSSFLLDRLEPRPSIPGYRVFDKTGVCDSDHGQLPLFACLSVEFAERIPFVLRRDFPTTAVPFSFYMLRLWCTTTK